MANSKQSQNRRLKMAERAQQQLALHFPNVLDALVWRRKTNDGFTTVPRTLPIAMQAIDATSKGAPAGHSLFCLWARAPDNPLVAVENPATFAAETGFTGERSVDTWRKRMRTLRDLGFIQTKPGASGEFHYILRQPLGVVGCIVPAMIWRRVDLPEPLRPMMPTASPRATSKDTSRRA